MSKAACNLKIHPRRGDIVSDVRKVLVRQGWEVERDGDKLLATEDATRLCCVESPAAVTLIFKSDRSGATVEVAAAVPGFGPVSARNVRSRLESIARVVLTAARATHESPPSLERHP